VRKKQRRYKLLHVEISGLLPISSPEIQFWLPGVYALSTKKTYFEMFKKIYKKLYVYISTIYVRSSSFGKNQYFLYYIKKIKFMI
jgi:hypothetical protein